MVPRDGRAGLATLTEAGLQRPQGAWPAHLAGVRALAFDYIEPDDLADFNRMTERLLRAIENPTDVQHGEANRAQDPDGSEPGAA